jgi:hypothetical protein
MSEKENRSFNMETDALPGMKLTRTGHLPPQQHEAFIELMERSGLDEHQRKDMVDRLIDRLKGI